MHDYDEIPKMTLGGAAYLADQLEKGIRRAGLQEPYRNRILQAAVNTQETLVGEIYGVAKTDITQSSIDCAHKILAGRNTTTFRDDDAHYNVTLRLHAATRTVLKAGERDRNRALKELDMVLTPKYLTELTTVKVPKASIWQHAVDLVTSDGALGFKRGARSFRHLKGMELLQSNMLFHREGGPDIIPPVARQPQELKIS